MGWLRKRLKERSSKIQLCQLLGLVVSLATGVPIEAVASLVGVISAAGVIAQDKTAS